MKNADNPAQRGPDQRLRYVLLAIEAEVLSEQATSPYIHDAYLRLSQFWVARAAASQRDGNLLEQFHAPTRKCLGH
jgi:hypothetical protein